MTPTFFKEEDHDEKGYYGQLFYPQNTKYPWCLPILTPYFEHKLDCEKYTRILAEANDLSYTYTAHIWFHRGYWERG